MKKNNILVYLLPIYLLILSFVIIIAVTGSNAYTAYSENVYSDNRKCIIIDAGHGGVDGGAISCTGFSESNINLEISLRLKDILELIGMKTMMIRTTDRSMHTTGETIAAKKVSDLKYRVKTINNVDNALLISIHQNNFTDSRYSGAQVFYKNGQGSATFAEDLQDLIKKTINPGSNRMAKRASGIYLLDNISCTGVLVECGFLSNADEEAMLRDPNYQKQLCSVIALGCNRYLYCTDA